MERKDCQVMNINCALLGATAPNGELTCGYNGRPTKNMDDCPAGGVLWRPGYIPRLSVLDLFQIGIRDARSNSKTIQELRSHE